MYNNFDNSDKRFEQQAGRIGGSWVSGNEAVRRADDVHFYQWMDRNFKKSGIFSSQEAMLNYINKGAGYENTFNKVLQGKGYEAVWINKQRRNPLNVFNRYDAGNVANRPGSDVSEISLLTGETKKYQMKAYTSNNIPDLHNTPKDMTVVTNAEKVKAVSDKGYIDVEAFQTTEEISKRTQARMNQIKNGKVYTKHTLPSTFSSAAASGIGGALIGSVAEAVSSHRAYINGEISSEEYAGEIMKSGAQAGATAAITTAASIPVAAVLATAGVASTPVMIPVSMAISKVVDNAIAPIFKRGIYKEAKEDIEHTQSTLMNPMGEMAYTSLCSAQNTMGFVDALSANLEAAKYNNAESLRILDESTALLNSLISGASA